MPIHAMIDIETLGTCIGSQIISVGAVKFDPNTKEDPFDKFYMRLDIDDQDQMGFVAEKDTLDWWEKQDPEVIISTFDPNGRVNSKEMFAELRKWYAGCSGIWSQGTTFDVTLLEFMARQYKTSTPWKYWEVRDSRTLFSLLPKDPRKKYTYSNHNALEDSIYQAKAVQDATSDLGVSF